MLPNSAEQRGTVLVDARAQQRRRPLVLAGLLANTFQQWAGLLAARAQQVITIHPTGIAACLLGGQQDCDCA